MSWATSVSDREPLRVAIHVVDLAHIRVASSVAIIGAGPIGLPVLQTVRLAGARIDDHAVPANEAHLSAGDSPGFERISGLAGPSQPSVPAGARARSLRPQLGLSGQGAQGRYRELSTVTRTSRLTSAATC
ncbi:hypothetical protein SBV1_3340001 [Verrucomicrobia bacterium]|nr:hypothetical protein SBV1_3340001 [Verrucomicrobiota bacterium]